MYVACLSLKQKGMSFIPLFLLCKCFYLCIFTWIAFFDPWGIIWNVIFQVSVSYLTLQNHPSLPPPLPSSMNLHFNALFVSFLLIVITHCNYIFKYFILVYDQSSSLVYKLLDSKLLYQPQHRKPLKQCLANDSLSRTLSGVNEWMNGSYRVPLKLARVLYSKLASIMWSNWHLTKVTLAVGLWRLDERDHLGD